MTTLSEIIDTIVRDTPALQMASPWQHSLWRQEFMRSFSPAVHALHAAGWRSGFVVNGFRPHG